MVEYCWNESVDMSSSWPSAVRQVSDDGRAFHSLVDSPPHYWTHSFVFHECFSVQNGWPSTLLGTECSQHMC